MYGYIYIAAIYVYVFCTYICIIDLQYRALGGTVCLLSLYLHDREYAYVHAHDCGTYVYFLILLQYFVYGTL